MQIFAVAVIKGGTGKSTTAAALAQAAASAGKKVLTVDLDPQANLTFIVGADQNKPGSYQLLHGTPAAQLIQHTEQGIDSIAASPDLATEKTTPASAKRLREALQAVSGLYDVCFIDTPPTMGELTYNALQACNGLLIPLESDIHSLQGLYQITDIAHQMQHSNPDMIITGVILTRYDGRANINKYLRSVIEEKAQAVGSPFIGTIRPGIAIREAQALQKSLYEYAPNSKPAQDYKALYNAIMK